MHTYTHAHIGKEASESSFQNIIIQLFEEKRMQKEYELSRVDFFKMTVKLRYKVR